MRLKGDDARDLGTIAKALRKKHSYIVISDGWKRGFAASVVHESIPFEDFCKYANGRNR